MRARLGVLLVLLVCIGACGDSSGHAQPATPRSSEHAGAWGLCTTRLEFADAMYTLGGEPSPESPAALEVLKGIDPPAGIDSEEGHWTDLVAMATNAVESGVPADDIADRELYHRATWVVARTRDAGWATSCDPAGLPGDFGCRDGLTDCARQLARGDGSSFSSQNMLDLAHAERWKVDGCFDDAWHKEHHVPKTADGQCTLTSDSYEHPELDLTFMSTTDGRWIAWTQS